MLIYKTLAGSRLYGYHTATSDYDYRGVFITPIESVLGLSHCDDTQTVMRTDDVTGETSDIVTYELRKFCKLGLQCNPNILDLLFAAPEYWKHCNPLWIPFYTHRHKFISQRLRMPYKGFLQSEIRKLEKSYNGKAAANAWRIAVQAQQLLRDGEFSPTLEDPKPMTYIREGSWDADYTMSVIKSGYEQITNMGTDLPKAPDTQFISRLCVETYRIFYDL